MADGNVVIVTGGTYGIGRGITLKLAGLGWRVVAFGLDARQPRLAEAAKNTVQGRNTLPADLANAVAFLLSDEAEMISGAILNVNGFVNQGGPIRTPRP